MTANEPLGDAKCVALSFPLYFANSKLPEKRHAWKYNVIMKRQFNFLFGHQSNVQYFRNFQG